MKIVKASNYSAYTSWHYTFNNNKYYFHMSDNIDTTGLPDPYTFDTDVIEYIINTVGKAQYVQIVNRSRIIPIDWAQQQTETFINFIYSTITNAYVATTTAISNYLLEGASIYGWDFEFTGSDEQYPGWDTYGTAYGFRFTGVCGDKIDLTLDSQGDFYGNNPIGNYQINPDPEPYNWILINQGLDNFYVPSVSVGSFNDLKPPYISGKELHFFYYDSNIEHEVVISDFEECILFVYSWLNSFPASNPAYACSGYYFGYKDNVNSRNVVITDNNSVVTPFTGNSGQYSGKHGSFNLAFIKECAFSSSGPNINLPVFYLNRSNINAYGYQVRNSNYAGIYNENFVAGSGDLWLESFSYTPNTNPNPIPETPIPVTQIPEDPEDPIPTSNPEPVPGITYPVNPTPIPLPPYVSIVSGNDDLWGNTIEYENIQEGLLPYINGLSQFEFPSFTDLISDFSGSLIWVAQIMSVLYNGTGYNILFVCLCLFSLVSVLIGAYKLWSSSGESDPYAADRAKESDPYARNAPKQYWKERKSKRRRE